MMVRRESGKQFYMSSPWTVTLFFSVCSYVSFPSHATARHLYAIVALANKFLSLSLSLSLAWCL